MTIAAGPTPSDADDSWAPLSYWLTFAIMGAVLTWAANLRDGNSGSHFAGTGAMIMWVLSQYVAAACTVLGAILMVFRRTRLFGIAALSAGFGGFVTTIAILFSR